MLRCLSIITVLLLSVNTASAKEIPTISKTVDSAKKTINFNAKEITGSSWVNQAGSVFTISSVSGTGLISGSYVNNEAGFDCQGSPYPVTGWILGTSISFSVIWNNSKENCNSVTGWTGYYYNGQITTDWNLAPSGSTQPSQIVSGQDIFTYQ